jgi:hypothetical protein
MQQYQNNENPQQNYNNQSFNNIPPQNYSQPGNISQYQNPNMGPNHGIPTNPTAAFKSILKPTKTKTSSFSLKNILIGSIFCF